MGFARELHSEEVHGKVPCGNASGFRGLLPCALVRKQGRWLLQDRYCGNCSQELRADDQLCPGCGQPAPETARVPTLQADEAVSSAPALQEVATAPPAEQSVDIERKGW